MSTQALFKRLTAGIKFDTKAFSKDASKFGLSQKQSEAPGNNGSESQVSIPVYSEVKAEIKEKIRKEKLLNGSEDDEGDITVIGKIKTTQKKKKKRKTKTKVREAYEERLNQFRNSQNIHVSGTDVPEPFNAWSQLAGKFGVSERLLGSLTFLRPTPVQMQAIPALLEGRAKGGRSRIAAAPTS